MLAEQLALRVSYCACRCFTFSRCGSGGLPRSTAVSVLCFTLSRGVVPFSVSFIGADFLLTASALCYFLLLLRCFQNPGWSRWLVLGVAHAAAFLAKAFAMPWLTVSTLVAAVVANRKSPQKAISYALLALLIPFMTWTGWGAALQTK